MTSMENVFICLAAPLLLAALCLRSEGRRALVFVISGMTVCLLSAYVSTFLASASGTDLQTASHAIAPAVEETMKCLPLLFYLLVFEPEKRGAIRSSAGAWCSSGTSWMPRKAAASLLHRSPAEPIPRSCMSRFPRRMTARRSIIRQTVPCRCGNMRSAMTGRRC